METNTVLVGDALEKLRTLPDESVHCIVTSPPYWMQRDYGVAEQIGREETFAAYLARLTEVFAETRRVLKTDGTLWLNMGDAYAGGGRGPSESLQSANKGALNLGALKCHLPSKNLLGLPWRLVFALQDAGWILRADIIWHKPNPMPASVKDRPTLAHEYIFLLSKTAQYYYDATATATAPRGNSLERARRASSTEHKNIQGAPGQTPHTLNAPRPNARHRRALDSGHATMFDSKQDAVGKRTYQGFNARYEAPALVNARSVWEITVTGFGGGHFATFPLELAERCVATGCPRGGIVLDPFLGSGTTGLAAQRLGRQWVGIELNPEYAELARQRIDQPGLFSRSEEERRQAEARSLTLPLWEG